MQEGVPQSSAYRNVEDLWAFAEEKRQGHQQKQRPAAPPPQGVVRTVVQILGELLLTCGVILLLFVGWELWWTNVQADNVQEQVAEAFTQGLQAPITPQEDENKDYGPPPVTPAPEKSGTIFGLAFIPRFGPNYKPRPLVQNTTRYQLDTLGLGHYVGNQMPGEAGNFALAGHRQTRGAVLDRVDSLKPGDHIYIQTAMGYYTYTFRNTQIVLPSDGTVLFPVPTVEDLAPKESILTMTSCNPRFGSEERIITYSSFQSWRPLKAGPPKEIAAQVQAMSHKKS